MEKGDNEKKEVQVHTYANEFPKGASTKRAQPKAKISLGARIRRIKPCFGFFLTGGVKAISFIDVCLALYSIVYVGLHYPDWATIKEGETQDDATVRVALWGWYLFHMVMTVLLSWYLFWTANLRHERNCKIWIAVSGVLYIIWIVTFFAHIIIYKLPEMTIALYCAYTVYRAYTFVVIYAFINEIRLYGGFNQALRGLTDEEVEEFVEGNPAAAMKGAGAGGAESAEHQPYNKNYEIPLDKLDIDTENPLGKGAYGLVLKGTLKMNDDSSSVVAIKTTNPNADVTYFKALLSELKIMTYIGRHDNLVNLVGACTSNIRDRNIFIVVEFCPYGSLHQFLKSHRGLFHSQVKDGVLCKIPIEKKEYSNMDDGEITTTSDLLRWCYEIGRGLEFLSNKRVIHSDLATRNVLLTYGKAAKISDFGLSRQLYQYSNYVKSQETPLPWRWMALESLTDMNFSSESDVWAYGVTVWEIFSLAEIPFPGLSWNVEFVEDLTKGLRMSQPEYATRELYDFLLQCWHNEPELRPTPDRICTFFKELLWRLDATYTLIDSSSHSHVDTNEEIRDSRYLDLQPNDESIYANTIAQV